MANTVSIILDDEQLGNLKQSVYKMVSEAVGQVKKEAGLEKRFLRKKDACKYLGVSNNTLDKWIDRGFPRIAIDGTLLFDKEAMNEWLVQRQDGFI